MVSIAGAHFPRASMARSVSCRRTGRPDSVHSICERDCDGGEVSFETECDVMRKAGIATITYTSSSHAPEKPRCVCCAPFSPKRQLEYRTATRGAQDDDGAP